MFNVANIVTTLNLFSGILSILFAVLGYLDFAVFAIFAGAIFDFLDGLVARAMNTMSDLGKQLDSLADMVTFGVAPGIIMMVVLTIDVADFEIYSTHEVRSGFYEWIDSFMKGNLNFVPFIALIIPFFSLFRLAKFNLDTRQSTSFIGLPTPANTLFYTTYPLVLVFRETEVSGLFFHPLVVSIIIVVLSLMMISEIPLFSLKIKSLSFKENKLRFIFLLISLIFILVFNVWAIALIVFLYLILSMVENIFTNKK